MLRRKLIRDLWVGRWQYIAVSVAVALGVTFYAAAAMAYRNLEASYRVSYERLRFEDFGISFRAAPAAVADRARRVPGVLAVEGRLVEEVQIELPGARTRKLIGRLISLPPDRRPAVNDLRLVEGRFPRSRTAPEVLVEHSFAKHHRLRPGGVVEVTRDGGRARFHVAGTVMSAEYLFVVRSKQDLMPFPETFGVLFVPEDVLGPLVGKAGQINELRIRADQRRRDAAQREVARLVAAYRPEPPVPREDQPSFVFLEQDIEGFRAYSVLFPALFLSVAALTVYTLLTRMVYLQRPMIGLLRALGVPRRRVLAHYAATAVIVGVVSGAIGAALGTWIADPITRWYLAFVTVPYVVVAPHWGTLVSGWAIGAVTCTLAGLLPAAAAARIGPSEALRAAAPVAGRGWPIDRYVPGLRNAPLRWRLPFRNLVRQPRRTASSLFGIAAAIVLLMLAQGILDSADAAFDAIVSGSFTEDMRLEFLEPRGSAVVNRVRGWPGVTWAEATLAVPVHFRKGDRTYDAALVGLPAEGRLQRLATESGEPVQATRVGLIVGQTLQRRLRLEVGDTVEMTLPQRRADEEPRPKIARIAGFVWEPIGTVAYARIEDVRSAFGGELNLPPGAIGGIRLKVNAAYIAEVRARLLALPGAGAVLVVPEIRQGLETLMGAYRRYVRIMLFFGAALAFSVVFNMVTINILERSNEAATMRTLGLGRGQIAALVSAENALLTVLGLAIGLPTGRWLVDAFLRAAMTEAQGDLFTMRVTIHPATYALAAAIIVAVVFLSQWPSLRYLARLDLARATKERAL